MGWSGGIFTRARDWTADEAGAIDMLSVNFDQEDDNFEAGINACLTKDGANSPSANLPMGGNRHTGVGNAAAKTDYASAADVIDQDLLYYVDTGAADAYVITPSPSISAYEEGQRLIFRATNASTGASTLNVNALGAITIETNDAVAIAAGMIAVGGYYEVTYDANGSRFVLTSPHSVTPAATATSIIAGTGMTGGGTLAADRTFNVIGGTGITANANDIATDDSAIDHDALSNFVAAEHVDWAGASAGTIHSTNLPSLTEYMSLTFDGTSGTAYTNQPNSVQFWRGISSAPILSTVADLTHFANARLLIHVSGVSASANSPIIYIGAKTGAYTSTAGSYTAFASTASAGEASLTSGGKIDTDWFAINGSFANTDNIVLAVLCDGGDGAADPISPQLTLYLKT